MSIWTKENLTAASRALHGKTKLRCSGYGVTVVYLGSRYYGLDKPKDIFSGVKHAITFLENRRFEYHRRIKTNTPHRFK
jgi:hypothetical protein